MIEKISSQLKVRYTKLFEEINSKVYFSPVENGTIQSPTIVVGDGGFDVVTPADTKQLNPPAILNVSMQKCEARHHVYRIAIPISEIEIAARDEHYFNALFDAAITLGLGAFRKGFGEKDAARWGESYCTIFSKDQNVLIQDSGEHYVLMFRGVWAGNPVEGE